MEGDHRLSNIAVHAYVSVDWRIVLVTVTDDLPILKRSVATLLDALPAG